jgi:hypothetical protein
MPDELAYRNLELLAELKARLATRPRSPWIPELTDEAREAARSMSYGSRRSSLAP